MEARFRPRIQASHGCEPLGALEYPIGWIEGPDYEDQLGARDDSPHPHNALRRLKDMGDGTYVRFSRAMSVHVCSAGRGRSGGSLSPSNPGASWV